MTNKIIKCRKCDTPVDTGITLEQLEQYDHKKSTMQESFPTMSASQREMFMSGFCTDCFDHLFQHLGDKEPLEEFMRQKRFLAEILISAERSTIVSIEALSSYMDRESIKDSEQVAMKIAKIFREANKHPLTLFHAALITTKVAGDVLAKNIDEMESHYEEKFQPDSKAPIH